MSDLGIPCRVSADLRALDRKQTAAALDAPKFTYLEEDFRHIVPAELARPFELLYGTVSQIEAIRGSFGKESVDAEKALAWLLNDIRRIEEQILIMWENA
jgi:hypothetical protein